jgi:hypothetical protein
MKTTAGIGIPLLRAVPDQNLTDCVALFPYRIILASLFFLSGTGLTRCRKLQAFRHLEEAEDKEIPKRRSQLLVFPKSNILEYLEALYTS